MRGGCNRVQNSRLRLPRDSILLQKTHLFSPCLSRACLGEVIIYSIKMAQRGVLCTALRCGVIFLPADARSCGQEAWQRQHEALSGPAAAAASLPPPACQGAAVSPAKSSALDVARCASATACGSEPPRELMIGAFCPLLSNEASTHARTSKSSDAPGPPRDSATSTQAADRSVALQRRT